MITGIYKNLTSENGRWFYDLTLYDNVKEEHILHLGKVIFESEPTQKDLDERLENIINNYNNQNNGDIIE